MPLRRFQKMCCIFVEISTAGTAQLGDLHHHFGQAQHFRRLVLLACALPIALLGLRQVATRCKFNCLGRMAFCGMLKIDGCLTPHIDFKIFKVAHLQGLRKTRRCPTRFWRSKCETLRTSRTKCSFYSSNILSQCSGSKKRIHGCIKTSRFWRCQSRLYYVVLSFLRGKCGTSWHSHVSATASKLLCPASAILLQGF